MLFKLTTLALTLALLVFSAKGLTRQECELLEGFPIKSTMGQEICIKLGSYFLVDGKPSLPSDW